MALKRHHSPHTRTRIVWRYNSGVSASQIAREEGVSRHAIYGIVRRYRDQESAADQPKSGRPRIIGDRERRRILRVIAQDPHIQIRELIEEAGLSCCRATLISYLRKEGIMHYKSLLRPFLSEDNARKRLRFARRYVHMAEDFWESWTFSDEVIIARGEGQRRTWVFCKPVYLLFAIANFLTISSTRGYSKRTFRLAYDRQGTRRCSLAPSTITGGFQ
uniref:DNA transposase n=1 Tax=Fusarium solani TaxID=169388 RepID=Q9C1K3_FUSSL|nr:DNA transposase [Fusarium breviconum]